MVLAICCWRGPFSPFNHCNQHVYTMQFVVLQASNPSLLLLLQLYSGISVCFVISPATINKAKATPQANSDQSGWQRRTGYQLIWHQMETSALLSILPQRLTGQTGPSRSIWAPRQSPRLPAWLQAWCQRASVGTGLTVIWWNKN